MQRPPFRLMLVTDRTLVPPDALPDVVARALDGGVDAVQLREKDLPDVELRALGRSLRSVTRGRALLLLNGPAEVARAVDADGLHLPESEPWPSACDWNALVGRSVHSVEAAGQAVDEGADYLVLGTIFPSRSHPGGQTGGIELIRAVRAAVETPLIAIGGVTAENAREVIAAGADGVAVISAILAAPDPAAAAAELCAAIEEARAASIGRTS